MPRLLNLRLLKFWHHPGYLAMAATDKSFEQDFPEDTESDNRHMNNAFLDGYIVGHSASTPSHI
ncbi:MAG TPA: hypothetical protein V6C84_11805 [Coleofasciculaceae cyanobacterium]|jgi:hypothetical protein